METETVRTKGVDKAQKKEILFFFFLISGIFHRGDMQSPKKASKESVSNDIVFNLAVCQLCREIFFCLPH